MLDREQEREQLFRGKKPVKWRVPVQREDRGEVSMQPEELYGDQERL